MNKLSAKSLGTRLSIIIVLSSLFTFLFFIANSYNNQINSSQENVIEKLHAITKTISIEIDAENHSKLTELYSKKDGIVNSEDDVNYLQIHNLLKKAQLENNINSDIYTLFIDKNNNLSFAVTSGITPYFRHSYNSAPKEIKDNFKTGGYAGPYKDAHGVWLSAFSPIKNKNGETIAIVQADQMFNVFISAARKKLFANIIISIILFIFTTSIVLFYVKKLTKLDQEKTNALNIAFNDVKDKNKNISDSINYAKRIQNALIPSHEKLKEILPKSFMMYHPKDIVSGDFPWVYQKEEYVYLAAVDCTGHGVPGAMMSIIGALLLNDIANNVGEPTPEHLLNLLHNSVVNTLKQEDEDSIADGMDIALCRINTKTNEFLYSGAHRPLYVWNKKEVLQFKGNKCPIGGVQYNNKNTFSLHNVKLNEGDVVLFFSDGLQDQFNKEDRKFGAKRIREIMQKHQQIHKIEENLQTEYSSWKGEIHQTDDILVIGIQF